MTLFIRLKRLLPLAVLWLSACAVQTSHYSVDSPLWQQHQQQLSQITRYEARGAFAWLDGRQKLYARFFWQQTAPDNYRLVLTSPLGSTEMDLQVAPNLVQLLDNKGQRHIDTDPQRLISRLTGMNLPFASLRQWLLGLPGNTSDYTLNQDYCLQSLRYQQGDQHWQVRYPGYDNRQHPALPAELELQQDGLRIKLKINHWTIK